MKKSNIGDAEIEDGTVRRIFVSTITERHVDRFLKTRVSPVIEILDFSVEKTERPIFGNNFRGEMLD